MTRLGELLVKSGKITPDQLEEALSAQQAEGGRVGTHLVKMGFIDDDDLVEFLSQRYGVPAINLGEVEVDESITKAERTSSNLPRVAAGSSAAQALLPQGVASITPATNTGIARRRGNWRRGLMAYSSR